MMNNNRDSNMELLRIVAICLVLICHANFLAFGKPSCTEVMTAPIVSFVRLLISSFSQICVNLFVLLAGWYGIHFRASRLLELMFQVVYFTILIWGILACLMPKEYIQWNKASTILMLNSNDYWFIKAYIGLYILSPVINRFIESTTKRQLRNILLIFYVFQTIYGFLFINAASWIVGGYSVWSFIGLYMLARYLKLYPCHIKDWKSSICFLMYCIIAISLALIAFVLAYNGINVSGRIVCSFTNPLSIMEAVFLLLAFSKMHFCNKVINWIGISCVAVYLLHANELILRPYFGPFIVSLSEYPTLIYMCSVTLFLILLFIVSIMLDKVRIYFWNLIKQ